MESYYMGTIIPWAGRWIPEGFYACEGQTLSVQQYAPLFSIIGSTYGGDGRTTFALPDLRNRIVMGGGQASSGATFKPGQIGGDVTVQNLALIQHNHVCSGALSVSLKMSSTAADLAAPSSTACISQGKKNNALVNLTTTGPGNMDIGSLSMTPPALTGMGPAGVATPQAVDTSPPRLVTKFIICWDGIYPSLQ